MKVLIGLTVAVIFGLAGIIFTHERGGPAAAAPGSHGKIQTISSGQTVDITPHLQPGTWTVVEFTADW